MARAVLLTVLIGLVHLPAFAGAGVYDLPAPFCDRSSVG